MAAAREIEPGPAGVPPIAYVCLRVVIVRPAPNADKGRSSLRRSEHVPVRLEPAPLLAHVVDMHFSVGSGVPPQDGDEIPSVSLGSQRYFDGRYSAETLGLFRDSTAGTCGDQRETSKL